MGTILFLLYPLFLVAVYQHSARLIPNFSANPALIITLMVVGAFFSARYQKRFQISDRIQITTLTLSLIGGWLMGIGLTIAKLPPLGNVLTDVHGIYYWLGFALWPGFVYVGGMMFGGGIGVLIQKRLATQRRPQLISATKQKTLIQATQLAVSVAGLSILFVTIRNIIKQMDTPNPDVFGLTAGLFLPIMAGFCLEQLRICMALMMKEIYLTRQIRTLIRIGVICIVFFFLQKIQGLVAPSPTVVTASTLVGAMLMGLGYMLADGCFMGSIWRAGQGRIESLVALGGMFLGVGIGSKVHLLPLGVAFHRSHGILAFSNQLALKLLLSFFIILWVGAYLSSPPGKVLHKGPSIPWVISETALMSSFILSAIDPNKASSKSMQFGGLVTIYLSLLIYGWARLTLGQNWGVSIVIRQNHQLIADGPYRFMKHPIYLAAFGAVVGFGINQGSLKGLLLTILIVAPTLYYRAKTEEKFLGELEKLPPS